MKFRVCHISLVTVGAVSAFLVGCGLLGDQASSTFETENSVALVATRADGSPAARSQVLVRPEKYLAEATYGDLSSEEGMGADRISYNAETDDKGQFNVPKMKSGRYVVEIRNGDDKGTSRFTVSETECERLEIELEKSGSLSGQVLLPAGVSSVKVGVRGLDYVVETDSLGNFEFESLPAGSFNVVGFVYSTTDYINEDGEDDTYESFQALGVAPVTVRSKNSVEGVIIGSQSKEPSTEDFILFDFEDSTFRWNTSNSKYSTMSLDAVDGGGKYGLVAHMDCHSDSLYTWTMMGHNFATFHDFTSLDSVVLWVRGQNPESDSMWISVSFDVMLSSAADSALGYETGKAWAHMPITDEWSKVVVTPDDMVPSDSNKVGGNIGWDQVRDHVNRFGIFAGRKNTGDFDVWVDDVKIYGVPGLE
ncbi:MAG: hypothetical protein HUK19_06125 [Fibrobacter sp.]|nr:hypothetical protein [Fibrobacter sp.]